MIACEKNAGEEWLRHHDSRTSSKATAGLQLIPPCLLSVVPNLRGMLQLDIDKPVLQL